MNPCLLDTESEPSYSDESNSGTDVYDEQEPGTSGEGRGTRAKSKADEACASAAKHEETSSESDGDTDVPRCPICLRRLLNQRIGVPESCTHSFCLECIKEWSKVTDIESFYTWQNKKLPPVSKAN